MEKVKALIRNIVKEELDTDLNELARISEKVKIGDKAKADKIKKLYSNAGAFKWIADIIEVIEKAGDAGIARMDAIDALHKEYKQNKTQQEINPKLKDLIDSGILLSAGLSQPKAEKNVGGERGRPTSEKTKIARQVDAKLQDDKEYNPTEDELNALGAEFIEKLRKRVKGELKRGRPAKAKDDVEDVLEENNPILKKYEGFRGYGTDLAEWLRDLDPTTLEGLYKDVYGEDLEEDLDTAIDHLVTNWENLND